MHLAVRVSRAVLSIALLSQLSACGTLLYPERRGQIGGRIDPAIVVFDAIDLLFYIIPSLIAFGADFATDAIYLLDVRYLVTLEVPKDVVGVGSKVDNRKLKAILERETGRELPLDDPRLTHHSGSVEQPAAYDLKPTA